MPVITLYYDRLKSLIKGEISTKDLVDKIPYLGVTLEEATDEYVKIEYNPNRPDLSTSYGIARSLNGILGFERGAPSYVMNKGEVEIIVDESTQLIRPFIVGLVGRGITLSDELIEEIISMQEDLHEGIGRHRRKMSIGIHNFDVLKPPIKYTTVPPEFKFIPLGQKEEMSMKEILDETDVGREYGRIVSGFNNYPLLIDGLGNVLSFPPIINGELTRLTSATRNLLIEITATDLKVAEDALAIIAATLNDIGAQIESVKVRLGNSIRITPDMSPQQMEVDRKMANDLLGLKLKDQEISECLERSRISLTSKDGLIALIPRYRVDILHQVDLVEEIAYGYGFERFTPTLPIFKKAGKHDENLLLIGLARNAMIGLGFIEVMNYNLTSQKVLYEFTKRKPKTIVKVENPKSIEHEILRDDLFSSLLMVLSKNLHEEYPQRIFEISKVFSKDLRTPTGIREVYHLATAISHSTANYTEAKSILSSLFSQAFNLSIDTIPTNHPSFTSGRVAKIVSAKNELGIIGEIDPSVLENFRLRNPVSIFEVNLSKVISIVKQKVKARSQIKR
ncbi:MAG: phenylalanine--tRNA ligase subunit beta [archaeon]|nr:phenylalanine--tRNA ligase subunit beta [archaeon]MCP8314167.1 phenylalanine--tRNA ligase subunit beta [archaeon]